MRTAAKLILFPLVVMILLSAVGVKTEAGLEFDSRSQEALEEKIPVSDQELENATSFMCDNIVHGSASLFPVPEENMWTSYWYENIFNPVGEYLYINIWDKLDRDSWDYPGREEIILEWVNKAEDVYENNENRDCPSQSQTYKIISQDPQPATSELDELGGFGLGINSSTVFIGLFIGLISLAAIVGIRVFGSGLSDRAAGLVFRFVLFFILWSLLSLTSRSILLDLPIVGFISWFTLTLMYFAGVVINSDII